MLKLFASFILLYCSVAAAKPSPYPTLLGHNLSITSHVLRDGECTTGFVFTGCAVNEKLSLGFSPWLAQDYKMLSVGARYQLNKKGRITKALQMAYFKTIEDRDNSNNGYEMESLWLTGAYTKIHSRYFATHTNLHFNYYFDETLPFSLRRPYLDPNPLQLNLSTLLEVKLYQTWFLLGEVGLLDILNDPLHTHAGMSLGKKWLWGYIYLGYSYTTTLYAMFEPTKRRDYQRELAETARAYDGQLSPSSVKYDYSLHPEFSIQIFF